MKAIFLVAAAALPLAAQWLHYPTPGIPRTPDGKPNLSAPAPKTADGKPDLSGAWDTAGTKYFFNLAADGVEAPTMIAILYESYNHFRQVFLDGRALPPVTQPAYMGYSIGRWEGDTLVVDTTGLDDRGWLDMNGHPQTETTHIVERYRRSDFGHLDLQLVIEDPNAYSKPWGISMVLNYFADEDMIENMCENERDYSHLVGK